MAPDTAPNGDQDRITATAAQQDDESRPQADSHRPTGRERYSPATAWPAEGARVGLVTCLDCGAAIFLSMDAPALTLHDAWHERVDDIERG